MFFVIAGILTLLMRLQMTRPDASILGSETYQGVLTMHGTLLVFFVLVPVVTGLATFLVPLLIGSRRIAMPGLAATALWLFVFAGAAVVLSAFADGGSSQAGWTGYPPLSLAQEGNGVRLWLIGLFLLALSVLASAVNLVATIRSLRTDGMTWSSMPMFVWSVYVWAWATIVLVPVAAVGLGLLLLERRFPGSFDFFLTSDRDGQALADLAVRPVVRVRRPRPGARRRGRDRGRVRRPRGRERAGARPVARRHRRAHDRPRALPRVRGRGRQEAERACCSSSP